MDKFEWQGTHENAEQCYLLEGTLILGISHHYQRLSASGLPIFLYIQRKYTTV